MIAIGSETLKKNQGKPYNFKKWMLERYNKVLQEANHEVKKHKIKKEENVNELLQAVNVDKDMVKEEKVNEAETQNNDNEMVCFGEGSSEVRAAVFNGITWKSHTKATRTLLMELFSRNILATHSLTGLPSPAFRGKKAKPQLDPRKVSDIVEIVSKRCRVSRSLVRLAITSKCADERKLFKSRGSHRCSIEAMGVAGGMGINGILV